MSGWIEGTHSFKCGACGTEVRGIYLLSDLHKTMELHALQCPGYPPCSKRDEGALPSFAPDDEAGP